MDDKKQMFLELVKKFEEKKKEYIELSDKLKGLMAEVGVNQYIQDPDTLAVYKIVEPSGTYVEYKKISYERTALSGEKRGSLSKSEAEEAGFVLKK